MGLKIKGKKNKNLQALSFVTLFSFFTLKWSTAQISHVVKTVKEFNSANWRKTKSKQNYHYWAPFFVAVKLK